MNLGKRLWRKVYCYLRPDPDYYIIDIKKRLASVELWLSIMERQEQEQESQQKRSLQPGPHEGKP